jgi:hypothetical protein
MYEKKIRITEELNKNNSALSDKRCNRMNRRDIIALPKPNQSLTKSHRDGTWLGFGWALVGLRLLSFSRTWWGNQSFDILWHFVIFT